MSDPAWTDVGLFWAAIGASLVGLGGTILNYHLLRTSVDPQVIVYASADETRRALINLVVENIGRGLARNITFDFSSPLPGHAFGGPEAPMPQRMTSGPLITGIPALAPGEKRVITWGQYDGLKRFLGDSEVVITVEYASDAVGVVESKRHKLECPVEVLSFAGTDASDTQWDKKAADSLAELTRTLNYVTTGFGTFKVELVSPALDHEDGSVADIEGTNESDGSNV